MAPDIPPDDASLTQAIEAFVTAVRQDDTLQRQLRLAATASDLSAVANAAGFELEPAQLVKHYARRLLEADDALAVRNFDRCSWDAGELLWLLKTWED